MPQDASFSTIPDAPSIPTTIAALLPHHNQSQDQPEPPRDPSQVPLDLSIPKAIKDKYPSLSLRPYSTGKPSIPSNVLALLSNATNREIADLLSMVIPALENNPSQFTLPSSTLAESFRQWWRLLLRFFFFVAETNDEVINVAIAPILKYLTRRGDVKTLNSLQKQRKSVADRYEFTMQIVFRTADKALTDLNPSNVEVLVDKLHTLTNFVLGTMQLVMALADDMERIAPELNISGLENVIADKLGTFAKEDKPVMIFICARWMNNDEYIKPWVIKYGGVWARLMYKSWFNTYQEQRVQFMDDLAQIAEPTNKPDND